MKMILHLSTLTSCPLPSCLWAPSLTTRRFLNLAGSGLSSAGPSCLLLANLRKLDNVRLLKVNQHLDEWQNVCPLQ